MVPQHKTCGNGHRVFFRGFLRQPALIGSVIPSSRFLERRIVEAYGIAHSRMVVELGPGTGGTTRAILPGPAPASASARNRNQPRIRELPEGLPGAPPGRLSRECGAYSRGTGKFRPYPA